MAYLEFQQKSGRRLLGRFAVLYYLSSHVFSVSSLLLDDALKLATPLSNGAISGVAGLSASSSSKAGILNL